MQIRLTLEVIGDLTSLSGGELFVFRSEMRRGTMTQRNSEA